jgi:hypothetical protein
MDKARTLLTAIALTGLTATANAAPAGGDSATILRSPGQTVSVETDGIKKKSDDTFLKEAFQKYLQIVGGRLPLPQTVLFINDPNKGPMYQDGAIFGKFPYYATVKGRKVVKTPAESVPLLLHELTHQVFETYIQKTYMTTRPQMVWAFLTRIDMMGEVASRELIDQTKAATDLNNVSTDDLMQLFGDLSTESTIFNEFLADALPTLYLDDPDAIYNNAAFKGDKDSEGLVASRRYGKDVTAIDLKRLGPFPDEYSATLPAKVFIWREVRSRMRDGRIKTPFPEVAEHLIRATIDSFDQLTNHLTTNRIQLEKQMPLLNRTLIGNICRELAISPCMGSPFGSINVPAIP